MTEQERELSLRAVKAFPNLFKDVWKHYIKGNYFLGYRCSKCKHFSIEHEDTPCTVPDPMPITWDNAMKLRDAVTSSKSRNYWDEALREVHVMAKRPAGYSDVDQWFVDKATLSDYILAACRAKEKSNEAM